MWNGLFGPRWPSWLNQAAKPVNLCVILLLHCSNPSISLPIVAKRPDIDFLVLILLIAMALCGQCFGAGWLLSRLLNAMHAQQVSMTFGQTMAPASWWRRRRSRIIRR